MSKLVYTFYPKRDEVHKICEQIKTIPNIKFVSLVAVDLGNNHTDEKIPIAHFVDHCDQFLAEGIQTDGSSVYLPEIAEINNAKVDLIPDQDVKWIVDYNQDHIDKATGLPVGTLIIPAFLMHEGALVGSRAVLKRAVDHFESTTKSLLADHPHMLEQLGIDSVDDIASVNLTVATELEFWVKSPDYSTDIEKLSTSQSLKEHYWKRTVGKVRTAMEKALLNLDYYDYDPEMGHKEVGGITARLKQANDFSHVMEQLEIDWRYDSALQSADNELFARDIIKDTFVREGLEVTFRAKPIEGVAGSGEHHHLGVSLSTTSGQIINLFAAADMKADYLNACGYGALMGILNHYELINPFVTSTNDAFNRLKPGFEAPVCIVGSLGHSAEEPSRNRTVLIGLVRDIDQPLATRFELRSPNPMSNSYLLIAAVYQAMLDGMTYALADQKDTRQLLDELLKQPGEASNYLKADRQYICEHDVFDDFTPEQRNERFGEPPANVFQNLNNLDVYSENLNVLKSGHVFSEQLIDAYKATLMAQWSTELGSRIIPEGVNLVRESRQRHEAGQGITDIDVVRWEEIQALRHDLMKDSMTQESIFSQIKKALNNRDYTTVAALQVEMADKLNQLSKLYSQYKQNLFYLN